MGFSGIAGGLKLQAATPVTGFSLQNGTPVVISWTPPNDGNLHRILVFLLKHVTSTETGGAVNVTFFSPDGASASLQEFAGGQAAGIFRATSPMVNPVQGGNLVTVTQSSPLTAGASVLWAEIWGT